MSNKVRPVFAHFASLTPIVIVGWIGLVHIAVSIGLAVDTVRTGGRVCQAGVWIEFTFVENQFSKPQLPIAKFLPALLPIPALLTARVDNALFIFLNHLLLGISLISAEVIVYGAHIQQKWNSNRPMSRLILIQRRPVTSLWFDSVLISPLLDNAHVGGIIISTRMIATPLLKAHLFTDVPLTVPAFARQLNGTRETLVLFVRICA